MDDFYVDQKSLAAYFEMQWLDKLRECGVREDLVGKSGTIPDSYIFSDYTKNVACFISSTVNKYSISPQTVLEVGPALGRNCYELVQSLADIDSITVVEPSVRFLSNFAKILVDGSGCDFTYIKSLNELGRYQFDTALLARDCNHVKFNLIDKAFGRGVVKERYDLTICLNVLDQCESPSEIVEALKKATDNAGVAVLSCSYQWNKKHLKDESEALDDINEYFGDDWQKLSEDDHEYKIRFNERYSLLFLTH